MNRSENPDQRPNQESRFKEEARRIINQIRKMDISLVIASGIIALASAIQVSNTLTYSEELRAKEDRNEKVSMGEYGQAVIGAVEGAGILYLAGASLIIGVENKLLPRSRKAKADK